MNHLFDTFGILDHLDFCDEVRPCRISEKFGDLATEIEELAHDRLVDRQAVLKLLVRNAASVWTLCEFEL